jgi:hypothetical protein
MITFNLNSYERILNKAWQATQNTLESTHISNH